MYYKKLFCMFFAVVFLFSSASVAVARFDGSRSFRSNDIFDDVEIGNARPLSRVNSLFVRILERFLPRSSIGLDKILVEDDESEGEPEEVPEEEPDEVPEEEPEEDPEESPSEGGSEEESVDLDLSIQRITIDEGQISITVDITNNGDSKVVIPLLSEASEITLTDSDGKSLKSANFCVDSASDTMIYPSEVCSDVLEISESLSPGMYNIKVVYDTKKAEENLDLLLSDSSEFEVDDNFNLIDYVVDVYNGFSFRMQNQLSSTEDTYGFGELNRGSAMDYPSVISWVTSILGAASEGSTTADEIENLFDNYENEEIDRESFLNAMETFSNEHFNYYDQDNSYKINRATWFSRLTKDYVLDSYLDNICQNDYDFLDYSTTQKRHNSISTIQDSIRDNTDNKIDSNKGRSPYGLGINRETDLGVLGINYGEDLDLNTLFPFIETNGVSNLKFIPFFDPQDNTREKFKGKNGRDWNNVKFMNYEGETKNIRIVDKESYKAMKIDCEDGYSAVYILPKDGKNPSELITDKASFEALMASFSELDSSGEMISVSIPIFDIGYGQRGYRASQAARNDLTDLLKNMGMMNAFSNEADFTNMISSDDITTSDENLSLKVPSISQIVHTSVNEEGIEIQATMDSEMYTLNGGGSGGGSNKRHREEKKEIVIDPSKVKDTTKANDGSYVDSTGAPRVTGETNTFKADGPFLIITTKRLNDGYYHDPNQVKEIILSRIEVLGIIVSPLVLDLEGDGITTSGLSDGVLFDLNNDGQMDLTGWTAGSDDAFLCLDLDMNGVIDDGGELFGDNTVLSDGSKALNGFEALAQYDSNSDGKIDKNDRIWPYLRLWCDSNHNGVSEKDELIPIMVSRVEKISLYYSYMNRWDNGNLLGECSSFTTRDGSTHNVIDVWFAMT